MVISRRQLQEMVDHCRAGFPNEACGILASRDGKVVQVYPLTNAEASPVFYRMDPQEQLHTMLEIDDRGWDVGAIFHSHTRTRAYPSQTDVGLAQYPGALYIIVSLASEPDPDVRAFSIEDGEIREEQLEVVE